MQVSYARLWQIVQICNARALEGRSLRTAAQTRPSPKVHEIVMADLFYYRMDYRVCSVAVACKVVGIRG
jgi:hypothetical protein